MTPSARSTIKTLSSPTLTHAGSISDIGDTEKQKQKQKHKKTGRKGKGNDQGAPEEGEAEGGDGDKVIELDIAQDEHIDPTLFAFRPYHLASLVDPQESGSSRGHGWNQGSLGWSWR